MRVFIAVILAEELRAALWDATAVLREQSYPVRWVPRSGMHLTLKFLGDVSGDRVGAVQSGLVGAVAGQRPFDLTVEGFGGFPNARRARVLWAGVDASPPLELMHNAVEVAMDRLSFPPEGKVFRPHLTLGRLRRGADPKGLEGIGDDLSRLEFTSSTVVDRVELMESVLNPQGAQYRTVDSVVLDAGDTDG